MTQIRNSFPAGQWASDSFEGSSREGRVFFENLALTGVARLNHSGVPHAGVAFQAPVGGILEPECKERKLTLAPLFWVILRASAPNKREFTNQGGQE
jgi:hypothetical protein